MDQVRIELFEGKWRLRHPFVFAGSSLDVRPSLLLKVSLKGTELSGWGEATPLKGFSPGDIEETRSSLLEWLNGSAFPALNEADSPDYRGFIGPIDSCACSAVQSAWADLRARTRQMSVAELWGAAVESVEVNRSLGAMTDIHTRAIHQAVQDGAHTWKLKWGARTAVEDRQRALALLNAHPALRLRLDANQSLDPQGLLERIAGLDSERIAYIEEPLRAEYRGRWAALREQTGLRFALDESYGSAESQALLNAGVVDVLVLKPSALGGPRALARIRGSLPSQAHPPALVLTSLIDGAVARAFVGHTAAALSLSGPHGLGTGAMLLPPDVPESVERGTFTLRGPGLGVEPDTSGWSRIFEREVSL